MSGNIEFTRNYSDQSTDKGFQFEFYCDRCGTGYRTRFKPTAIGRVAEVLDTASGMLGGIFGRAADITERARSSGWERAHDDAFVEAMKDLRPDFIQCPRCSSWVCKKSCWNNSKGLCKECAPDVAVEMAAAQSSRTVQEVWSHSKMADEDMEKLKEENWREGIKASCPECNAPLSDNKAKFCPECGAKVKKEATCTECGSKIEAGARFCSECGTRAYT